MAESEFTLSSAIEFLVDEKSVQKVNQTVNTIKGMIGKALGAIGIGFSLKSLNDTVEQFQSINLSLSSAVGDMENMDEVQEKILKSSKDVLGNYEDIAKNVGDLVKNNRTLFDVDNATRFTEVMTKLTKLSGGSNADASGLVSSMATAMKNGKFDSGSLEALFAKAPQAVKVLTDYYGVSEKRLRTMAQAGILKAKDIQKAFLNAGESVDKEFAQLEPKITDVLGSARSELKYFISETDEMFGITKLVAKYLREGIQFLMGGLQKVRSGVIFLSQKLGGMENTLKILAAVAAAFVIAMNFDKIVGGVKSLLGIFSKLGVKGTLIVAIITLIILSIQDFVYFMKGHKSLLGNVLERLGIDADEVRQKIFDTWEKIKDFFKGVAGKVQAWWGKNSGSIKKGLVGFLKGVVKFIKSIIGPLKEWWSENGEAVVENLKGIFVDAKDLIVRIGHDLEEFWDQYGDQIIELILQTFKGLVEAGKGLVKMLGDLWDILKDLFSGNWDKLWEDLGKLGEDFLETILSFFDNIYDSELGKKFFDWGKDMLLKIVDGLLSAFDKAKQEIQKVWNWFAGIFGVPIEEEVVVEADTRSEYEALVDSYVERREKNSRAERAKKSRAQANLDDAIINEGQKNEGWASGKNAKEINDNLTYTVKTQELEDAFKALDANSVPNSTTTTNTVDSHDKTTNVTQNVEVNQTFNGDTAVQKNMKRSADHIVETSTDQMARAMEFPR